MSKNAHSNQKQNYKSNSEDMLKRRPIHQETEHSDENQKKYVNLNNSPQKPENLYPELPVEDEIDDSGEELNDIDGVFDEAELQSIQKKGLLGKAKKSHKGNEVKLKKKHLSDVPITSTLFYENCSSYFIYILLVLLALFGSLFYISKSQKPVAELSLNEKLKNMQDIFQDQNYLTFRILENALKKVVNVTNEPSAPAIFTVTVNKNAIYKSHEFLRNLAGNLAPRSIVLINESVSWRADPDGIKLKIDEKIQSVAKSKDLFVVIVDNLQNVPPKGAMIFHSYCDHESAPFKQAVFLFIVPLDEVLPKESASKKIDGAAFRQLKNIWNYASSDEIDSLITRITVNVINIR